MSRRIRRITKSTNSEGVPSITAEPEKPNSTNVTEFNDLKTRVDIIDANMKLMSDKLTPVDLKGIENKMTSFEKIDEINANFILIKNELHNLSAYAKIFFGVGTVALLLYCINGLLTILNFLRPVK
jgi:hypothetical protein